MRLALAILFSAGLIWLGIGMLRSLGMGSPAKTFDEPIEAPDEMRIVFRCQTCGTEVLLLQRGSAKPPRHCGEAMIERAEIA